MPTPRRGLAAALTAAVGLAPLTLLATAPPASAADPANALGSVVINEVSSNGFAGGDFIELYNTSSSTIDLTGYHLKDNKSLAENDVLLDGKIAPRGYAVYYVDGGPGAVPKPFGLGGGDEATLLSPDGATVIDTYTWTTHRTPSYARVPDGSGEFAVTTAPTPGGPNSLATTAEAQVNLNEVFTDGAGTSAEGLHDFAEIHNGSGAAVDLTGWYLSDGAETPNPADRVTLGGPSANIPAGGYLAVETELMDTEIPAGFTYLPGSNGTKSGFGLNKTDWVFLFKPDGTLVSTTFKGLLPDEHANTFSRVHPGTGLWKNGADQTPGAVNSFPGGGGEVPTLDPNWDDVEINEISSLNNGQEGTPIADAVELVNTGDSPVSIEGWWQTDSGAASGASALSLADLKVWNGTALEPAAEMSIPAGGYVAFSSKKGLSGEGDAVKVYGPGLTDAERQLVDEQAYGDGDGGVSDTPEANSGAKSFAACADGSDDFWRVTVSSFGQDNAAACETKHRPNLPLDTTVVLNEVSDVAGKVELFNTGTDAVDISGWTFSNAADAVVFTVPAATTLDGGAYFLAENIAGLGPVDSLTVTRPADGASFVGHSWTESGVASYSRCEAYGVVGYVETPAASWGAANVCGTVETQPWPGGAEVTLADADANLFTDVDSPQGGTNGEGDVSGVTFAEGGDVLWAVMNKGRLFKLAKTEAGTYDSFDAAWDGGVPLAFADGDGQPDSEGVTVGPDGALYITSERDNERNKSGSWNVVLRYDVSTVTETTGELVATHQWDVHSFVPTGSNLGLEGITYVPDAFLVDAGWTVDGAAYTAGLQPTDGLFVTAVEGTGDLHFFSLAADAAPVEVKVEKSGFPFAMDVAFDAERRQIWALCDDSCGGVSNVLKVDEAGDFAVTASYARPAGMPNLNNEGLAIAPGSTAVDGMVEAIWADDGDTDGYSLRAGTLPAPEVELVTAPSVTGDAVVGATLTGTAGSWQPDATFAHQWLADGAPITGATSPTLALTAAHVGAVITLQVTASAESYVDGVAVSEPTAAVAPGTFAVRSQPTITGRPIVGNRVLGEAGTVAPWPGMAGVDYQWLADGEPIEGATRENLTIPVDVLGGALSLRVTYTAAGYDELVLTSEVTAAVAEGTLTVSRKPAITGKKKVGSTLRLQAGATAPSAAATITWFANGKGVKGAKGTSLKVTKAMAGKRITARVVYEADGYTSAKATTKAVKIAKVKKVKNGKGDKKGKQGKNGKGAGKRS